ncbi:hypothetical protein KIV12_07350 [Bacillus altitudinis]|uniref:hypothetical protein n=1 Tax=Bacillus altitudinis TaxID=293387 RepID=UPI001C3F0005|nr:hypothetical protein [Bacillus altitudinis]MDH3108924.1 hypothetical protein [Bacillus altitudinis]QXJ49582.1 hypothetical protein KIV12_07350 [Bacillus altitudinis]
MDIKFPKVFETSDKAHADLFNEMVKVLLVNDSGLLDQITGHTSDTQPHASAAEKKKWNESQIYKITADNGTQLINVPVGSTIFDAIKDKGICTFYARSGIEDSPSQYALRGMQTVGQDNIGTGFAIDTSGNAYYFYYNSNHISIIWTQLPTVAEKDKWNNGQLYKLTQDSGDRKALPTVLDGTDILTLPPGRYYAAGQYLTNKPISNDSSWFNIDVERAGTRKNFHVIRSVDNVHWFGTVHTDGSFKGWERMLTEKDAKLNWKYPTIGNGWKTYQSEVNNDYRVRVAKDAFGTVTVKGAIAGGTLGDVPAFTLPEGCEPVAPFYNLGVASSTGGFKGPQYSRQYIATDGRFCIQSTSSNTEFIVVNCMFKAKEG